MDTGSIVAIIIAVIGVGPGVWAAIETRRNAREKNDAELRAERKRVDAEAYERARQLWESAIAQTERQAAQADQRATRRIDDLTRQLKDAENDRDELRREVGELHRMVEKMRTVMRTAGLAVPNPGEF